MASFTPPPSTPIRDIGRRITWPFVLVILLVSSFVFILTPVLAIDWVQHVPFPSVLLAPNLLVSDAAFNDWGPTPELQVLDHIIAVNDTPVSDQSAYDQALIDAQARGEDSVGLTIERSPGVNPNPCGILQANGLYRVALSVALWFRADLLVDWHLGVSSTR
jgi:hypothetical protein